MNARLVAGAAALVLGIVLVGCGTGASDGADPDSGDPSGSPSPTTTQSPAPGESATATPKPTSTSKATAIPTDCRAILSEDVLAQLEGVPLNDAAFGPSGVGDDGTLTCIWADPRADTTRLVTTISAMNRGPALDMLNALADDEGFSCFTPDGGTRCEKTWPNEQYPVTDGRTLFWRDDVLIDTRYSNLAPSGYTSAIVDSLFD